MSISLLNLETKNFLQQFKNKKNKFPKQEPIDKKIILSASIKPYYIPYFKRDYEWKKIHLSDLFDIMYYTYNKNLKKNKLCSIDVGVKYFLSCYTLTGTCFKVKINYNKVTDIIENDNISYEEKNIKLKDMIVEIHLKICNFICNMFNEIYIGLVLNDGYIDSMLFKNYEKNEYGDPKYLVKFLFHTDFLYCLDKVAKNKNKTIHIVDESYTSNICTNCGTINKFKRILDDDESIRRMYSCDNCKLEICRDINASRNILLKNLKI